MDQKKIYLTPSGFKKLQGELEELVKVDRPKVVATVAWAASNGDRSENADYIYGKRRLRQIDSRIRFLRKRLENAQIVDSSKSDPSRIFFGAQVVLLNEQDKKLRYVIVGEDEIDPQAGKISWKSPMARALLGKSQGAEVCVLRPSGEAWFEILEIKY